MSRNLLHIGMTQRLLARAEAAAEVEGLTRPEFIRRAIVSACERTEQLEARRKRLGTGVNRSEGKA